MSFFFASGQDNSTLDNYREKAAYFKNNNQYDSALVYLNHMADALRSSGTRYDQIQNEINICELLVQKLEYDTVWIIINAIQGEVFRLKGEYPLLEADYLQVKGGYLLGKGLDSCKYYLEQAIEIRSNLNGDRDTLLHFALNKLGNYYLRKGNYDEAINSHQQALNLSLEKKTGNNFQSATSYQNLGIAVHGKGDFILAEKYLLKSLELNEFLFEKSNPILAFIYNNVGKFYNDLSKYSYALSYYDKAELLLLNTKNKSFLTPLAGVYWNKGNIFTHQGDYDKAIGYLNKALHLYIDSSSYQINTLSALLMDIGFVYEKKGEFHEAIKYYSASTQNPEIPSIVKSYRNLGNLYSKLDQGDSSRYYYKRAIEYSKKFYGNESYDLALCYQYYGEMLLKNKSDSSLYYFQKARKIFELIFNEENRDIARIRLLIGENLIVKGDYREALVIIEEAISGLLPGTSIQAIADNNYSALFRDLFVPDALHLKAKALYHQYLSDHDLRGLQSSLEFARLSWSVIEMIRTTYHDEESQIILNNNARMTVDLGLKASLELYRQTGNAGFLSEAFQFSEKSKAIIMLSAMRGLEAKSTATVPGPLLERENYLNQEIATCNNLIYNERQKKIPDQAKVAFWNDRLFSLRASYDSLLLMYQTDFRDYFGLKYDYSITSADSILANLPDDQAMIAYHIADSSVYGFVFSDGEYELRQIGNTAELLGKLDSLRRFFFNTDFFNSGLEEQQLFVALSSDLYEILIRPFLPAISNKRLLIIPDGELGYLAFDLLLTEKPLNPNIGYRKLQWLIRSYPISYSSSATIYFEQQKHQDHRPAAGSLLAFAPSYEYLSNIRDATFTDSALFNLSPIIGTTEEVNNIARIYRGKKFFDQNASETNFKKLASDYGILHLAMHTLIDDQKPLYSKLVFAKPEQGSPDDGLLNTYELFNLRLKGELAVLSACNTGTGKLERGEGIISLARGFFYSGIPSVVMTLWEIEDYSSADLMAIFYQNLKNGMLKDVALQQAKLKYLEQSDQVHAHPYFWAGFVHIGKTDPIIEKTVILNWKLIIYTICIISFLIAGYLFINKRVYLKKKRH